MLLQYPPVSIRTVAARAILDTTTIILGYESEFFIGVLHLQTLGLFQILDGGLQIEG